MNSKVVHIIQWTPLCSYIVVQGVKLFPDPHGRANQGATHLHMSTHTRNRIGHELKEARVKQELSSQLTRKHGRSDNGSYQSSAAKHKTHTSQ